MKKVKNIIGILAILIFIAGSAVFALSKTGPKDTATAGTQSGSEYALAEVAQHSSQDSCWTTISGNVYDLTDWIGRHPGGEAAIRSICGKDGTSAFTGQHGDSSQPNAALETLKIGTLAK